ncbi:hypothetical protein [Helicobacter sp. 23-1045]
MRLNSWEVLRIYFYWWKVFVGVFAFTMIVSALLIAMSVEKIEKNEVVEEAKVEIMPEIKEYFSFYIDLQSLQISQNLIREMLSNSFVENPTLSLEHIENNIFKLTFSSNNLQEAEIYADNIITTLDSANLMRFKTQNLKKQILISAVQNDKKATIAKIPKPQEQKDENAEKDFVQTSFRSKIILAFITAFIFGSIAVFTMEFFRINRDKFRA